MQIFALRKFATVVVQVGKFFRDCLKPARDDNALDCVTWAESDRILLNRRASGLRRRERE